MSNPESLPLAGIKVLEFSHAVMGPTAGMVLADLGATVTKIEPVPDGDRTRHLQGVGIGYFPSPWAPWTGWAWAMMLSRLSTLA